jgi:hypothetical protein
VRNSHTKSCSQLNSARKELSDAYTYMYIFEVSCVKKKYVSNVFRVLYMHYVPYSMWNSAESVESTWNEGGGVQSTGNSHGIGHPDLSSHLSGQGE